MRQWIALFILIAAWSTGAISGPEGAYRLTDGRLHGDLAWPDILAVGSDDWRPQTVYELPDQGERFWITFRVDIKQEGLNGLFLSRLYSYRLYWDGILIGENGKFGPSAEEDEPGLMDRTFAVPPDLARPGTHQIYMHISRSSSAKAVEHFRYGFTLGDMETLVRAQATSAYLPLITLSLLSFVGIFAIALAKRFQALKGLSLFGALCLAVAALTLAESWRGLFNYPYDFHYWRLLIILALMAGIAQLLITFLCRFLSIKSPKILIASGIVIAAIAVLPTYFDLRNLLILAFTLLVCVGMAGWGAKAGNKYAPGILGFFFLCLVTLAIAPAWFVQFGFALTFTFLIAVILSSIFWYFRDLQNIEIATKTENMRLELELLKSHIQPHFLMNALNAVSDWIEVNPKTAVRFIEALGAEFRALIALSHRAKVSLDEELELCNRFLEVMGYRHDRRFVLNIVGNTGNIELPPGIIHTLVENGVTHASMEGPQTEFRLQIIQRAQQTELIFEAPAAGVDGSKARQTGHGTGHRFIKAALLSAFGEKAQFKSERQGDLWISRIIWPNP